LHGTPLLTIFHLIRLPQKWVFLYQINVCEHYVVQGAKQHTVNTFSTSRFCENIRLVQKTSIFCVPVYVVSGLISKLALWFSSHNGKHLRSLCQYPTAFWGMAISQEFLC